MRDLFGVIALVSPSVARPGLNGDSVGFEVNLLAVVELQPIRTTRNELVIDRVGGAHFFSSDDPTDYQSPWQSIFHPSKMVPLTLNLEAEFLTARGNPSFVTRSRD